MNRLLELAERVEKASGPDREVDCRIFAHLSGLNFETAANVVSDFSQWQSPAYTSSLDAAMSLVPEEHDWDLNWRASGFVAARVGVHVVRAATPALALTAAALRAHVKGEG